MALLYRAAASSTICINNSPFAISRCKQIRTLFSRVDQSSYLRVLHSPSCHRRISHAGLRRLSSTNQEKIRTCMSFDGMLEERRNEAQKSVLVQVHSGLSSKDLQSHCSLFGNVVNTMYYTTQEELHFILIEFEKKESAKELMDASSYGTRIPAIPVSSPFLWLRASENKTSRKGIIPPEAVDDSEATPEILQQVLQHADSVSHQIELLYTSTRLGNLGSRLRFLTARQMESALSGMFPQVRALPFGSSVNGFGRAGCDLDLVLQLGGAEEGLEEDKSTEKSRLVFHSKGSAACNGRAQLQRHMETIADVLHLFLPGCSRVHRILQARVPIIKFRHDLTMLDCDLSMTNMTAVHMSELLFLMGEADHRVRPLVFCVRRWAQAVGLTNPTPGRWVSNFTLTLLTLFFLQNTRIPVLPSLSTLIQLAGASDRRITADGINCTFLRDLSNLALSQNEESLEELLRGFFEFYSAFDFSGRGISLVAGRAIAKPEHSPLYLENPLERSLNVSKNVSPEETLRLRVEFRNAAWFFEQMDDEEESGKDPESSWGVLSLLSDPRRPGLSPPQPRSNRLVHVKDLFSNKEDLSPHHKSSQPSSKYKNYNNTVRQRRR